MLDAGGIAWQHIPKSRRPDADLSWQSATGSRCKGWGALFSHNSGPVTLIYDASGVGGMEKGEALAEHYKDVAAAPTELTTSDENAVAGLLRMAPWLTEAGER